MTTPTTNSNAQTIFGLSNSQKRAVKLKDVPKIVNCVVVQITNGEKVFSKCTAHGSKEFHLTLDPEAFREGRKLLIIFFSCQGNLRKEINRYSRVLCAD